MRKVAPVAALLLALSLMLGGCVFRGQTPESAREISLPEPQDEPENMILGESVSGAVSDVALYQAAPDFSGFSTVTQSLRTEVGESLPEAAVNALLATGSAVGAQAASDVKLIGFEYACGTATVNLSIDARNVTGPQELLALEAAIGNTLLDIDGVRGVNVLVGGVSEGCCQLPLGVQTRMIDSVTASYAQTQAERDRLSQPGAAPVQREALLYFPTGVGQWLIPEMRGVSAGSGGFAAALIEALKAGPMDEACAVASIPEGAELMEGGPVIETLGTGERVLSLNFSSALANYMAFSGLEVWELAGSVTLTMCSFLPELDAVRIMVNGEPITMCTLGDAILQFPDGLMRRDDFAGRVGSVATLMLLDGGDRLTRVERPVSMRSALSAKSILTELFSYTGADGAAYRLPVSQPLSPEDLLGVQVVGGVARVNLSANFYRSCQNLSPRAERDLVYAMVNTLCELDGIRAVRFTIEGRAADTLAGSIYLRSALLPNPGLVSEPAPPPTPAPEATAGP